MTEAHLAAQTLDHSRLNRPTRDCTTTLGRRPQRAAPDKMIYFVPALASGSC
jgi:hypothetical protein